MTESPERDTEHEPSDGDDRPVPLDEPDEPEPPIEDDEDAERPLRDAEQQ